MSTWWIPLTLDSIPLNCVFCKLGPTLGCKFSHVIIVVYDAHVATHLLDFFTHQFIAWISLQNFAPLTNFLVGILHNFILLTRNIFSCVMFTIFFYVHTYVYISDQCHGGIFSFIRPPHSFICISSRWLWERSNSNFICFFWRLVLCHIWSYDT